MLKNDESVLGVLCHAPHAGGDSESRAASARAAPGRTLKRALALPSAFIQLQKNLSGTASFNHVQFCLAMAFVVKEEFARSAINSAQGSGSGRSWKGPREKRRVHVPVGTALVPTEAALSRCARTAHVTEKGAIRDKLGPRSSRSPAQALLDGPIARQRPELVQRRIWLAKNTAVERQPALAAQAVAQSVGYVRLAVSHMPHVAVVPVMAVSTQRNAVLRVKEVDKRNLIEDARGRAQRDDVRRLQARLAANVVGEAAEHARGAVAFQNGGAEAPLLLRRAHAARRWLEERHIRECAGLLIG